MKLNWGRVVVFAAMLPLEAQPVKALSLADALFNDAILMVAM
jgi:hypothetical protein